MQQVLQELYRKHRYSLANPPMASPQMTTKDRSYNLAQQLIQKTRFQSVDLQKQKEERKGGTKASTTKKPSRPDRKETLLMKYDQDFKTLQKQKVHLPLMKQSKDSSIVSSRSNHTPSTNSSIFQVSMPLISKRNRKKMQPGRQKFIKCARAVIFILRLRRVVSKNRIKLAQMQRLSSNLLTIIDKTINKYYSNILKKELLQFGLILNSKSILNSSMPSSEIVKNMLKMTETLKNSSLRKDTLKFLTMVTLKNSPLPYDFLTDFQIQRLNFNENHNKLTLKRVTQAQTMMIVGVFLVYKLLCCSIFSAPWNVHILGVKQEIGKKEEKVCSSYCCYLKYTIMDIFSKLPIVQQNILQILQRRGVEPLKMDESKQNKGDNFYELVCQEYPQENLQIKQNIQAWVNRIGGEVMRNKSHLANQF